MPDHLPGTVARTGETCMPPHLRFSHCGPMGRQRRTCAGRPPDARSRAVEASVMEETESSPKVSGVSELERAHQLFGASGALAEARREFAMQGDGQVRFGLLQPGQR